MGYYDKINLAETNWQMDILSFKGVFHIRPPNVETMIHRRIDYIAKSVRDRLAEEVLRPIISFSICSIFLNLCYVFNFVLHFAICVIKYIYIAGILT